MSKRVLFVLMPEEFQDKEFSVPYNMLKNNGYIVDVAGLRHGDAIGSFGLKVKPDKILDQLNSLGEIDQYDALVITGGFGSTKYLWGNQELQKTVKSFYDQKKLVATICYACIVPVQAGILTGKKATVFPTEEAKSVFSEHNVIFIDEGVVILDDENIVTAQGPTFVYDFGRAIMSVFDKNR